MTTIQPDQVNQVRSFLATAQSILIAIGANPTLDDVAAGLALYLSLSASGKQVSIACPSQMTVEFSHLIGVNLLSNSVNSSSGRNLVISFPYQEGSIEKVSYNIENDAFNLVIEPREGYPTITEDVIRYSNSGGTIDGIITINAQKPEDLQHIYENNKASFDSKPVITVGMRSNTIGKINIVDINASSVSEVVVMLLSDLDMQIDGDIASNLLSGLQAGSQNYTSPQTNAQTFEIAAQLMKSGASKPQPDLRGTYSPQSIPQPTQRMTRPSQQQTQRPAPFDKYPTMPPKQQPQQRPFAMPRIQQQSQQQSHAAPQPQQSHTQQPQQQHSQQPNAQKPQTDAPADWLKPKIYKGTSLL